MQKIGASVEIDSGVIQFRSGWVKIMKRQFV